MSPKLKIISERQNPLLDRVEVEAALEYEGGTPSRAEVRKMLADALGKSESLVFVRKVLPEYGMRSARIVAVAYSNRDRALELEPDYVIARNEGVKEVGEAQGG